jgi:hypothetical protein
MKEFVFTSVFLFTSIVFYGQSKVEVKEQIEDIGGGSHNALVVKIYQCKDEDVLKEWKSIMKGYDAKVSNKKEMFADNAKIKDMSDNTVDVYARAESTAEGDVNFIVGFDLGGAYLSSTQHPREYKEAKRIVYNMAKDLSETGLKEKVKTEEKILLGLQKQKEYTAKENETLTHDIESYKEKVSKAEEKIKANQEAIKQKEKEIADQQKIFDSIVKKADLK